MRHRIHGKKLNRSSGHRKALFKNLARNLFLHGQITTTEAKARAVQPIAEKLITRAKQQNLASRRMIQAYFNDRGVTTRLVDRIAPQLDKRTSGFTSLELVGPRRGDNTMMAQLSLVDKLVMVEVEEPKKKNKTAKAKNSNKPVATS